MKYFLIYTSWDGLYTKTFDTREEVEEYLEEFDDDLILCLDLDSFDWQRANNAVLIEGKVIY